MRPNAQIRPQNRKRRQRKVQRQRLKREKAHRGINPRFQHIHRPEHDNSRSLKGGFAELSSQQVNRCDRSASMADETGKSQGNTCRYACRRGHRALTDAHPSGSLYQLPDHKPDRDTANQKPDRVIIGPAKEHRAQKRARHAAPQQKPGFRPAPFFPIRRKAGHIDQHQQGQHDPQRNRRFDHKRQNRRAGKGRARPKPALRYPGKQHCRHTQRKNCPAQSIHFKRTFIGIIIDISGLTQVHHP